LVTFQGYSAQGGPPRNHFLGNSGLPIGQKPPISLPDRSARLAASIVRGSESNGAGPPGDFILSLAAALSTEFISQHLGASNYEWAFQKGLNSSFQRIKGTKGPPAWGIFTWAENAKHGTSRAHNLGAALNPGGKNRGGNTVPHVVPQAKNAPYRVTKETPPNSGTQGQTTTRQSDNFAPEPHRDRPTIGRCPEQSDPAPVIKNTTP